MTVPKTACDRCGTCCRKGGPALHVEDLDLLRAGVFKIDDLITVRQGEYVYYPFSDIPRPAKHELIKIRGKGTKWCCIFLDEAQSLCSVYSHRPLACRLLKCWAPEDVLAITEKNLLDRFAVIPENEPVAALVREHEQACSWVLIHPQVARLDRKELRDSAITELTALVNTDLRFRDIAARKYRLSVAGELFCFGRPLFQLLHSFRLRSIEKQGGIILQYENM